jgi:hypothetical protein
MSDTNAQKPNTFTDRRPRDRDPRRRDHFQCRGPPRHRAAASVLFAETRLPAGRQLPRLHGRDRRRARLAASCIRTPSPGMKVKTQTDRAKTARKMVAELLLTDQPDLAHAHDPVAALANRGQHEGRARPLSGAREGRRARPQPSGDGGQSRRLHPMQSLRPRLPRSAGQRRDRHGRPRPRRKDRVRLRRSDGRLDLRRLRRMRAGLPDRRADAGDDGRRRTTFTNQARPLGRQRLSLLRRRLPAHLPHQGRQAALRDRPRRSGEPEPALRQRPLRLRLRQQSATPD